MDKKRSILNVTISIISYILLLLSALVVRRLLIRYIGNEVNGLNSLYTSIIGVLTVSELGIGRAITYSMYKPIVDKDISGVAALYGLYKRLYIIIGAVIFVLGLLVMPFLPAFISDYKEISVNVFLTFFLTLVSAALSYLYAAKTALIEAYKDNYITTGILSAAHLVRYGLQACAILIWKSFPVFLICQIAETLIIGLLTELVVRKRHENIITRKEKVDRLTKQEIIRNSRAALMHRIGTVLVTTIDSVIISTFIGVVMLGKYSNYVLIASVVAGAISLFFTPLTSVIGHLCAAGDVKETRRWFDLFYSLNYVLGVVFFLGYYAVIDYVIRMLFGTGLEMPRRIAFVITLNQFTSFMRKTVLLFRDASGTFYYDRWKPIGEGICNLVLSLLFVRIFPEEIRIVGVIAATVITTVCICNIVDPFVVFKHAFNMSVKGYYLRNYSYIGLFAAALLGLNCLTQQTSRVVDGILINGFISIGVSICIFGFVTLLDKSFRYSVQTAGRAMVHHLFRQRK